MEAVLDPGKVILRRIAEREVERAKIEAAIAADMLEFDDLRRRQAESRTDETARRLEASFAADELGVTLHQPTRVVQGRLAEARRVRGRLPQTWLAFTAGRIDAYRISLIASAVDRVRGDTHTLIELDYLVPGKAAARTAAQLKGWLKRFVALNTTDQNTAETEKAKRSVWLDHQDDGMTFLHAYLPTPDAIRIDTLLSQRARATSDDRTFDQRRVDELVAQMLGHVDGQPTSSRAVIGVVIPVNTLAGFDDQPGEAFDGSYALPADMVRDLATEPGTLFYRIMKDARGRILDITELGRFPSDRLRTAIEIRDGTCRFATCSRPVAESDLDHHIPHPRGPTAGSNLRGLCRRHHNTKTYGIAEPTAFQMLTRGHSRAERHLGPIVEYAPQTA